MCVCVCVSVCVCKQEREREREREHCGVHKRSRIRRTTDHKPTAHHAAVDKEGGAVEHGKLVGSHVDKGATAASYHTQAATAGEGVVVDRHSAGVLEWR